MKTWANCENSWSWHLSWDGSQETINNKVNWASEVWWYHFPTWNAQTPSWMTGMVILSSNFPVAHSPKTSDNNWPTAERQHIWKHEDRRVSWSTNLTVAMCIMHLLPKQNGNGERIRKNNVRWKWQRRMRWIETAWDGRMPLHFCGSQPVATTEGGCLPAPFQQKRLSMDGRFETRCCTSAICASSCLQIPM